MSTVRANTFLDSAGGNTATINSIPLRPGILDPENRIINGAFDFWQRGTSFTTAVYGADRWLNAFSGGTVTQSRQSFTLGDTLGNNSPTFFLRQTVSGQTLATQFVLTQQSIEGVRSYAGQTITVLGWARRSSGSGNMAVEVAQVFGTGGSPSVDVTGTGQVVTLTGSWAPFAVTFAVPSISGKTLGSDNNDRLALNFWTSAGSNWNARSGSLGLQTIGVDFWGIHIKLGTHTVDAVNLYKQPELGPELVRCQRYYEKSYDVDMVPGTVSVAGAVRNFNANGGINTATLQANFKVQKRARPAVSVYSPNSGAIGTIYDESGTNRSGAAAYIGTFGAGIVNSVVGNVANYSAHWVADAEL